MKTDEEKIAARSLHQPYAGLMALGLKTIETRKEGTNHRGELLIVSTQTMIVLAFDELRARLVPGRVSAERFDELCLQRGKALCVVTITGSRELVEADEPEALFFAAGRKAWTTDPTKLRLVERIPLRGWPGTFYIPTAFIQPFGSGR